MILWFTIGWPKEDADWNVDPIIIGCQTKVEAIKKAEEMCRLEENYYWCVSKTVYVPMRIKVYV